MRTMLKKLMTGLLLAAVTGTAQAAEPPKPCGAVPTEQQINWLRMEWYAFVHFGLNTYTNREWGYGDESPSLFNPVKFDADKIVSTFKEAGMTGMIYTAKHHDGWCAWPTATTGHNITQSPWKGGQGDVVREFADACAKNGIKFGTYLSPWDRNCAEYGRPGYLDVYYGQIRELLTNYGPIFEIWFDGAMGGDGYYGGARESRNIGDADTYYNYARVVEDIRKLQPDCIIWGASQRGDACWGGSEEGFVPYPCTNLIHKGTPQERWCILEGDTPINKAGWFWHPNQHNSVKSPQRLMQVYLDSVGHGANLILNVAPNRDGELDPADVRSLLAFGEARRKLLATDYALGARAGATEVRGKDQQFGAHQVTDGDIESYWCPNDGTTTGTIELRLPKPVTFDVFRVREQIRLGARVEEFEVHALLNGKWKVLDDGGRSIGNQVIRRLPKPVTTDRVRLIINKSRACPCISEFSLLRMPEIDYKDTTEAPKPINRGPWKTTPASAKAALDGNPGTMWQADKAPASFTVDMGRRVSIASFSYLPRQDKKTQGMTDRYKLEVSDDGKTWTTAAEGEFGNLRANPIEQRIYFSPVRVRFLRFTAERALNGRGVTVPELNFYGY